jgi:hypothetical protein
MCTVELNPAVDIPVTVNTVWNGPAGVQILPNDTIMQQSLSVYISTAMISSFGRNESGNYSCIASINSTSRSAFMALGSLSETTKVTTGNSNVYEASITNKLEIVTFGRCISFLWRESIQKF